MLWNERTDTVAKTQKKLIIMFPLKVFSSLEIRQLIYFDLFPVKQDLQV